MQDIDLAETIPGAVQTFSLSFSTRILTKYTGPNPDKKHLKHKRSLTFGELAQMKEHLNAIAKKHGGGFINSRVNESGTRAFYFAMPMANREAFKNAVADATQSPMPQATKNSPDATIAWPTIR